MSASLVGSEMCIRDREEGFNGGPGPGTLRPLSPDANHTQRQDLQRRVCHSPSGKSLGKGP
eukprot:6442842-Alexandrium_andersonii.AAC.1